MFDDIKEINPDIYLKNKLEQEKPKMKKKIKFELEDNLE